MGWEGPFQEEVPGFYATVRQDTREVLGIVGERYCIVQNEEAFGFIDQLLGSQINFETAGSLHAGRRVWVLATLPEHIEVGGDPVRPYVLLMNSHDGSTAVVAATTPVRVVCQNTLNWGLASARQKFSIRHTEAVRERVHEARRVLDLSINYYKQFKRQGDQLASQRCTERQLRTVLDELYPSSTQDTASARTRRSREHTKDRIVQLFLSGETQGNSPGSRWAAANAIIEYSDWIRPVRSANSRFARAIDDSAQEDPRPSASQGDLADGPCGMVTCLWLARRVGFGHGTVVVALVVVPSRNVKVAANGKPPCGQWVGRSSPSGW